MIQKLYKALILSILLVASTSIQAIGLGSIATATATSAWNQAQKHPKLAATVATYATWVTYNKWNKSYDYWNWDAIEKAHKNDAVLLPQSFKFADDFLWGLGTSSHQVEGGCNNTQTLFEDECLKDHRCNDDGTPTIEEKTGIACDHWQRYKEDIQLIRNLRKDQKPISYRFSLERSKIETAPHVFDTQALDHYADVCKELVAQGVTPVIGLHHYSDPLWFFQNGRNGFEDEHSIDEFGQYVQKVVHYLNEKVFNASTIKPLWMTFNSPGGYAARGYLTGAQYPGIKGDRKRMLQVFNNVLRAHVSAYKKIKAIDPHAKVGITKNIHQVKPWSSWNPLEYITSQAAYNLMDKCYYEFFTQGTFTVWFPNYHTSTPEPDAPNSVDFFGLNYYSHRYMKTLKTPTKHPNDEVTGNKNYVIYPEGLYAAIKEVHIKLLQPINKKRKPADKIHMYVTENGVATENTPEGHEQRERFYKKYMYAMAKAINDGYNIKGYMTWSLMDNYEWGSYKKFYGIYHVDRKDNLKRSLKSGSHYWVNLINNDTSYCNSIS